MTCIVGIEHKGSVWLGGDSAGVSGYDIVSRADPKVFTIADGSMLFGFTSSFRMGQLLRYSFKPPRHRANVPDMEYLVGPFVDSVRSLYKEKGFLRKDKEEELGGEVLLGYRGLLYEVYEDFQVGRTSEGFSSVGAGADIALGALHATQGQAPETRAQVALEAAARFSAAVRGPFTVIKMDPPASPRRNIPRKIGRLR